MTSAPEKPLLDAAVETLKERYPGWTGPVTAGAFVLVPCPYCVCIRCAPLPQFFA